MARPQCDTSLAWVSIEHKVNCGLGTIVVLMNHVLFGCQLKAEGELRVGY
jgi:hypothetical protein